MAALLRGPGQGAPQQPPGSGVAAAPSPSRTLMDDAGVEQAGQQDRIKVTKPLIAFGSKRSVGKLWLWSGR